MVDKNDPVALAKWGRNLPETERLLKQFCKYESSVDAKTYDVRHLYMEPCSNAACGPMHLTDAEREIVHIELARMPLEDAVLMVIGTRGTRRP